MSVNTPMVVTPVSPQSICFMADSERLQEVQSNPSEHSGSVTAQSTTRPRSGPSLACSNCRPKKVKCRIENGSCSRCIKLGLQCIVPAEDERKHPSSKKFIRELQAQIRSLQSELSSTQKSLAERVSEVERLRGFTPRSIDDCCEPQKKSPAWPRKQNNPLTMLAALCGGQWQLSKGEDGQMRFFGPTSSLHFTESVSSSIFDLSSGDCTQTLSHRRSFVSPQLEQELLDAYWAYQNSILHVVDKKSFLEGMMGHNSKYYSELLLCCILACAARISDRPEVRALSLPSDSSEDEDSPFFMRTATALLQTELRRPRITTVQSLLLLSVMDCAQSNNTRGWLLTGDACRLAIDLGLHRDCQDLGPLLLSPEDLEIRKMVLWSCFTFDRLWALYLGRPHCLRLSDITVPRLECNPTDDLDLQIASAWVDLLELVGFISDFFNGNNCEPSRITELDTKLQEWLTSLPPTLQYNPIGPPAIYILHMQYCSAVILLHRSAAGFGSCGGGTQSEEGQTARKVCVSNAGRIAGILHDYQTYHGSTLTMSGVALHIITMAATILLANIVESKSAHTQNQFDSLKQCMRALGQLEQTYLVSRRVRKIIQIVMRMLNLDINQSSLPWSPTSIGVGIAHTDVLTAPCTMEQLDNGILAGMGDDSGSVWGAHDLDGFDVQDIVFSHLQNSGRHLSLF